MTTNPARIALAVVWLYPFTIRAGGETPALQAEPARYNDSIALARKAWSLELIGTYRDCLEYPDELHAEYSKQWRAKVKYQSAGLASKKLVVFGVEVTDAMDPATIRIPFACTPESVKEVKAKVAEILKANK